MKSGFQVLFVVMTALSAGMSHAQMIEDGCYKPEEGGQYAVTNSEDGVAVRFASPEETRRALYFEGYGGSADRWEFPSGRSYGVRAVVERLAAEAGVAVFFTDGERGLKASKPLPLHGTWRGATPLECLRAFADALGLRVVVPETDVWLVGPGEAPEPGALLVFAYSLNARLQPLQSASEVAELEWALVRSLRVRVVEPLDIVGIGYWWIPGEPDTLLAVATRGWKTTGSGRDELVVKAFKVRVRREDGRVRIECLWSRFVPGCLIAGIREDFDGDGKLDFYFQAEGDRDLPDVLVAGADGSTLVEGFGESLAVQKVSDGPPLFSIKRLLVDGEAVKGGILRYSPEAGEVLRVDEPIEAKSAGSQTVGGTPLSSEQPGPKLGATLRANEQVRQYVLPWFDAPMAPGAEYVRFYGLQVWHWFVDRGIHNTMRDVLSDRAIHVLIRYRSEEYLRLHEVPPPIVREEPVGP